MKYANYKCLYYKNCLNGYVSAFEVFKKFPDAEFVPMAHHHPVPEVYGVDVIMIDFPINRQKLVEMANVARSILIIDHHKTAKEELSTDIDPLPDNVKTVFDLDHCGAVLAFKHFNPGRPVPFLNRLIEDWNLMTYKYRQTRAFSESFYLDIIKANVPFDEFCLIQSDEDWIDRMTVSGYKKLDEKEALVKKLESTATLTRWDGKTVATVVLEKLNDAPVSDLGDALCKNLKCDYAEIIYPADDGTGIIHSLRSTRDCDVSDIAEKLNGGGHFHDARYKI